MNGSNSAWCSRQAQSAWPPDGPPGEASKARNASKVGRIADVALATSATASSVLRPSPELMITVSASGSSWPEASRLQEERPVKFVESGNQPTVEHIPHSPQPEEDVPLRPSSAQAQNKSLRPGFFGKIKSFTASLFR